MYGLYIHIPFCVSKCLYCDFYSLPGKLDLIESYIDAVLREAQRYQGEEFRTLYIGGGTPSLLRSEGLRRLMTGLQQCFHLGHLEEATIEANPESADEDFFRTARSLGFTRISVGVQSLDDSELQDAGRAHNALQAVNAVQAAFAAGFNDVSADIMIGLPGQTSTSLENTLHKVIDLGVTHISAYCLAVEEGTPFADNPPDGIPGDDEQAVLYELARRILRDAGFVHYEVSNFALPGRQCRHNLNYWRGGDYLGLGPAAASHIKGRRLKNASNLDQYIENPAGIMVESEQIDMTGKIGEEAMLRLRLLQEGINLDSMAERYGREPLSTLVSKLESMIVSGKLVKNGNSYCLPYDKVLTSNSILAEIL